MYLSQVTKEILKERTYCSFKTVTKIDHKTDMADDKIQKFCILIFSVF